MIRILTSDFWLQASAEFRRWALVIAGCAIALALGAWWLEHDARVRQEAQAEILDRQDAATITALKTQADQAFAAANESAAREKQAEAKLAAQSMAENRLKAQLAAVQVAAQRDQQRRAALPPAEVKQAVAEQIGDQGVRGQVPGVSKNEIVLTETGVRKVDDALAELKSCQEQNALGTQLIETCLAQRDSLDAIARERGSQLDNFKTALKAQQDLAGAEKTKLERQVTIARGGWLRRTWEKVEVPVLLIAGFSLGVAVAR